jgi:hypothetical protein
MEQRRKWIEVELAPEIGAVLEERAKAQGLPLDEFAARALVAVAATDVPPMKATAEERERAFDEFVAGLESDVALPDEAFERAFWYPDRW